MSRLTVRGGGDEGNDEARVDTSEEPHAAAVEVADLRAAVRRRSSMSVAPLAIAEAASAISAIKAPTLVAGDQLARPHFLKDRSVTMRADAGLSASSHLASSAHQSKASTFLVKIVERSRSVSSMHDGKATASASNQQAGNGNSSGAGTRPQGGESDASQVPQRRRQSIVVSESHVNKLSQMQHQNTMPALLPAARPPMQSIRSGMTHLATHDEDEPDEYVTEAELRGRSLLQLVRDLNLYKKKSGTLLRILGEIQRRLQDAEIESSTGRPSHVAMCRELVDDGMLSGVVLVLREFRFHVALQTAAVALLSFLADVSDLYAYMMAELDVEPLVQKIVAVHVSQERLVMNGSSLIHTISEGKHKPHVVKMHKARQLEREKERAASFVEAFAAERKQSKLRELEGLRGRGGGGLVRDDQHRPLLRSGSRWQRSALSKGLGVPPVLTGHYDLEVSLSRQRSSEIRPLERVTSDGHGDTLQLDDTSQWMQPKTSYEPRRLTGRSSAAKLAAVYSTSPTFVAPSPLGKRIQATRKAHSAISARQVSRTETSGRALEPRPKTVGSVDLSNEEDKGSLLVPFRGGDFYLEAERDECQTSCLGSSQDCGSRCNDTPQANIDDPLEEDPLEEDPTYDDDDFDVDEEEQDMSNMPAVNRDRLLPVGSDSDLFELVGRSETDLEEYPEPLQSDASNHAQGDGENWSLWSPESRSVIDMRADRDHSTDQSSPSPHDMITSELVDLLRSCVNSEDPAVPPKPNQDSIVETSIRKPRTMITRTPPSSPALSVLSTIVRPVSKRILENTVKTSYRQRAKPSRYPASNGASVKEILEAKSVLATAQITTELDKIRIPADIDLIGESGSAGGQSISAGVGFVESLPPTSNPTSSVAQIQALYARGLQHHKANEFDAAVRCYEQGVHMQHSRGVQREFASLFINLGSARMAQQRPYDALVAFTQAERIQPRNLKAKFNSGLVLMQLAQWDEALVKFDQVVAADPCHVRAQCALEQCQRVLTQVQKSV